MKKICTTKEQSQKLIELGLDVNTADMWLQHIGYSVIDGIESPLYLPTIVRDEPTDKDIPAWSLTVLLDILAEQDFIIKTIGNEFNIDIPIRHCKIWFSSLLDAAFEMVVWMKKNGKI